MTRHEFTVRKAEPGEFQKIGSLMVQVYSQLEGFPSESQQPEYYQMLTDIGSLTVKSQTELLVAVSVEEKIAGAVVYFGDMSQYGSGGTATLEKNASGFRLLAVEQSTRGQGIGKMLTEACIARAKEKNHSHVIIHTTLAMQTAWRMYEKMGFQRSGDLDFMQETLPVFGFRLFLKN